MTRFGQLKLIRADYLAQYKVRAGDNLRSLFRAIPEKHRQYQAFDYYSAASSTFSSNIEGNPVSIDSFLKYATVKGLKRTKDISEIEDLIKAYTFAHSNPLTKQNFLKAHRIFSRQFLIPSMRGKIRKTNMMVMSENGIEYVAIEHEKLAAEFNLFFREIAILLEMKLNITERFYFASMIHLVFETIHPFADGNGRGGRLLEKWFLASGLGSKAWNIGSEKYYFQKRSAYYKNLKIGNEYSALNFKRCIPFLLMLPKSLAQ